MRISVDGGDSYALAPGEFARICRSEKKLRMLTLKKQSTLGVLCEKMQLLNPHHERTE